MNSVCIHFYVRGKVQGVWFRAGTQNEAQRLGIKGWVKNLPDGRVEVLACGDPSSLEAFHQWLKHGPQGAQVLEVKTANMPYEEHSNFEIKY